ncbi:MAG: TolC family protein [Bacteroidales bacterium]
MKHIKLLIICYLMVPAFLSGQNKLTLDLEGAKKHALEHNMSLINAGLAISKSELAVREAIANGLPQVNASADYSNALGADITIQFVPEAPPAVIPIKPQSNLYVNVGQLLFSGNYLVGIQTAKLYNDLSVKNRQKTELEVMTQVSDAYYLVMVSKELLDIMKMNVENLNELYEKMQAMEAVGVIESLDVDQLQVQVNTMQNAVKSSERQLELATNLLRLQLGEGVDTEIELTENLSALMAAAGFEGILLKNFDLNGNIDYQMMQQQVLISEKMVNMQKANALPTLSAFYRYTYKLLKPDFDMTPPNMLGLQMNIPIFSSGVRTYQVRQAEIGLETARNQQEFVSDQLRIQEKQLRYNYVSALETWQNQQTNIEVARRVYNNLKLKYEQGMISGLDLVNADNNYLRAETDYISSMMQVLSTRVQLEKLYGELK